MLQLLEDGLRETADYHIFERRNTFKLLLSFYDSALSDDVTQVCKTLHIFLHAFIGVISCIKELIASQNMRGENIRFTLDKLAKRNHVCIQQIIFIISVASAKDNSESMQPENNSHRSCKESWVSIVA